MKNDAPDMGRRTHAAVTIYFLGVQHRKDKPWDNESINHWEIKPFSKEENPSGLLEESSFATLFPKYRGICVGPLNR